MTRRLLTTYALLASMLGCTSLTPDGARVKVYEADLATPPDARRLPNGCRLLATTAPVDQMESERHVDDPYRVQRNATGAKGGNVLLVLSNRFVTLKKTDCAPSDTSYDCQNRAQNWYKVSFESYACDAPAVETLAKLEPNRGAGVASWWPFDKRSAATDAAAPASATPGPTPAATSAPAPAASAAPATSLASSDLKAKLLLLMREGVGNDVLVAYARSHRLSAALTAEEILDWKKSGIAESVIAAAIGSVDAPH